MELPDSVTNFFRKVVDAIDDKFGEVANKIGELIGLSPENTNKVKFGLEIFFALVIVGAMFA